MRLVTSRATLVPYASKGLQEQHTGERWMNRPLFRNRFDAGRRLAAALAPHAARPNLLILALPRGGVPVGYEVARGLNAPLDIMVVRKLGVPGQEELAMGAIASGGIRIVSDEVVHAFCIPERVIATVAANEEQELDRQERMYRDDRPLPVVQDRSIILVDDGLATGSTMRAAAAALRSQGPAYLAVGVPVAPAPTCAALRSEVDAVICLLSPEPFSSVGSWYEDFSQISDEDVRHMLQLASEGVEVYPWR